jgi:Protein of unknown function (DUF4240)
VAVGARSFKQVMVSTRLVAIAALLLATGYLLGTRGSDGTADKASEPAGNAAARAADVPSDSAPGVPSDSAAAPPAMNRAAFWGLIESARAEADNDTERQSELLEERLSELPPRQIVRFQQIRRQMDERAYTWDIWGTAFVIDDGCSDDCFRDFRAYLISLGPRAFAAALRNPDSLARSSKTPRRATGRTPTTSHPTRTRPPPAMTSRPPPRTSPAAPAPSHGTTSPRRRSCSATPRWQRASAEPTE